MTDALRRAEATDELLRVIANGYMLCDIATSLTCSETEAFAEFLRAHGKDAAADSLIECHAEDDDEGDSHYVPEDGAE